MKKLSFTYTAVAMLALAAPLQAQALTFNFTTSTGNTLADQAFVQAASRWSTLLADDVTINVSIGLSASLGSGILGGASSMMGTTSYSNIRNALLTDQTSADDAAATANLQTGTALSLLTNRTSDNPNGPGSATPYLDNDGGANNTTLRISSANAKALGLLAGNSTGLDGNITFSSTFNWDYNPNDGITSNAIDFVGVATHEIGHLLGFFSGVDTLDANGGGAFGENSFTYVNTLDLFRYSADSIAAGPGVIDWAADTRSKYFSLDGGTTNLAGFSTGRTYGDGRQASHWKDNQGIGIMDPTTAYGELDLLSTLDIRALDVIGWNLASPANAAPEPGTLPLLAATLGLLGYLRRKAA